MKLAYEIYLPPEGCENKNLAPVILLHGRMDSKKTWKTLGPEIAKRTGREVFTYDHRNHGDSPWTDDMNIDYLVDDLEEFMEDQDIPKAVLVGHSMGGKTALMFALRKPEAVERLIVEDMTATAYNPLAIRSVEYYMKLLKESLTVVPPGADEGAAKKAIIKFLKEKLPPSKIPNEKSGLFNLDTIPLKKSGNSLAWQANLDVLEKMLSSGQTHQEPSGVYQGEALFLYGTDSFFDVEKDEDIPKFFPRAVKVAVQGAGHLIHHDFPAEFLKQVSDFINRSL